MKLMPLHELPLPDSARRVYRALRGGCRKVRGLKNYCLNRLDPPVVILIYHRVTNLPADPEMIAVAPENFRRQMHYLKQNFRLLRLDEDWSDLREPAVVVTFDDGYADNLLEALPILEEQEVPATFFVSTGLLGTTRDFWWHRLETLLLRDGDFPSGFRLNDSLYGRSWDSATPDQRKALYASLCLLMRKLDPERQERWLEQLENWAGVTEIRENPHRCLTREELLQLADSPWATIGAHTVTHAALSALNEAQQREEIFSSKRELEEIIGKPITVFSYPFGRKCEYNRTSIRLCREAGFHRTASNFPGQMHKWTDPMQLPRHLVRNWDEEAFVAEMKGFWTR